MMTIQDFTDLMDGCSGKSVTAIRSVVGRLGADELKIVAKALSCGGSTQAVSSAIFSYLATRPKILHRGEKVWQDGYPYIVTEDTAIPADTESARSTQVPCTSIIAFGDCSEEQEYKVIISYGELTLSCV